MMKHADLKEDLKARGEPRSGLTAKLQHHLYALLVHAAIRGGEARDTAMPDMNNGGRAPTHDSN